MVRYGIVGFTSHSTHYRSFLVQNLVLKTTVSGYLVVKLRDRRVISFESLLACDKRTDGRTDTPIAKSRSSIEL